MFSPPTALFLLGLIFGCGPAKTHPAPAHPVAAPTAER